MPREHNTHDSLYDAGRRWVDAALRSDGSLLEPGTPVWKLESLLEFKRRFATMHGQLRFSEKLDAQLDGASRDVRLLAAEALLVMLLMPADIGAKAKREAVEAVLSHVDEPPPIPHALVTALGQGLADGGMNFKTMRDRQIRCLIELTIAIKQLTPVERDRCLADAWAFHDFARGVPTDGGKAMLDAALFLAFPDTFDPMFGHKSLVTKAFSAFVESPDASLDRQIAEIRGALEQEGLRPGFSFYDPALTPRWLEVSAPSVWEPFLDWAQKIRSWDRYDDVYRTTSVRLAEQLQLVRANLDAATGEWVENLAAAESALRYKTASRGDILALIAWARANPAAAARALSALWNSSAPVETRVDEFAEAIAEAVTKVASASTRIASALLITPEDLGSVYYMRSLGTARRLLDLSGNATSASAGGLYSSMLDLHQAIIEHAQARQIPIDDLLDAEAITWTMGERGQWYRALPPQEQAAFDAYVGAVSVVSRVGGLAERLLVDESWLEGVLGLLELKRQVVFFGPPGTGKTYVAREIAKLLAGEEGSVEFVQFHPAYSYEDFAQGYRPVELSSGQPGFRLSDGPLLRLAKRAREAPEATHVLVIDELNRGNVAKIFGELFFLLEYRDAEVTLAYQPPDGEAFSLPANIRVIATMNTADRSIALIDQALRRRFFFVGFHPDEHPVKGLLARWLERERPELDWIARLVDEANALLGEDARATGIGPSHFMLSDSNQLNEALVQQIWTHSILPTLEEHFYGQPDRLTDFNYHTLRNTKPSS